MSENGRIVKEGPDPRFEFLTMEERDLLLQLLGKYVAEADDERDEYAPVGLTLMDMIPSPMANETNDEKVERYTTIG